RRPAAPPAQPAPLLPPAYDRHQWEEALLAAPLPHHAARLLGWGLAHLAGPSGYFPPGSAEASSLGRKLRLSPRQVRLSLGQLQTAGLITRPDIHTWQPQSLVRPITLTMPPSTTSEDTAA
ncbi:hypothetical protein OQI_38770, partial [Streptomyces pharetrae CZA14]